MVSLVQEFFFVVTLCWTTIMSVSQAIRSKTGISSSDYLPPLLRGISSLSQTILRIQVVLDGWSAGDKLLKIKPKVASGHSLPDVTVSALAIPTLLHSYHLSRDRSLLPVLPSTHSAISPSHFGWLQTAENEVFATFLHFDSFHPLIESNILHHIFAYSSSANKEPLFNSGSLFGFLQDLYLINVM